MVLEPSFRTIWEFGDGVAIVVGEGRQGIVDQHGKVQWFPNVEFLHTRYSEGLVLAKKDGEIGFLDKAGNFRFKIERFAEVFPFSEGMTAIPFGNALRYVNKDGKVVVTKNFDSAAPFHQGIARVESCGKTGAIDTTGNVIVPFRDWHVSDASDGLIGVKDANQNRWTYFDSSGSPVLDVRFDYVGRFSEGLAPVKASNKWGFIDKSGLIVVKPQYEEVHAFQEGMAAVVHNDKIGFIDSKGEMKIKPKYDNLPVNIRFYGCLSWVSLGGTEMYIDRFGEPVWISE
ncbi:MAG: WG repeat-containing protein [Acidobacteriota bacterium]|nr:WG repeat-containing protein [Acidobacteriota bacterium]MDH3528875.1 WG repeat-containing protein [Acidobacteriota bacterium]